MTESVICKCNERNFWALMKLICRHIYICIHDNGVYEGNEKRQDWNFKNSWIHVIDEIALKPRISVCIQQKKQRKQ